MSENFIFILGTGRSGTSILHQAIACHPEIGFISNAVARFPRLYPISAANRLLEAPMVGNLMTERVMARKPIALRPSESEKLWTSRGLSAHFHTTETSGPKTAELLKESLENHLRFNSRKLLVLKQTSNNQRIRWINQHFPDSKYIHILRDPVEIVESLLQVSWINEIPLWNQIDTKPPYSRAHLLKMIHDELSEISHSLGNSSSQVLKVQYSMLTRFPEEALKSCFSFLGVDNDSGVIRDIASYIRPNNKTIESESYSPQERLLADQIRSLMDEWYESN